MSRAIETAPAKVNLALHVTGRRPDGYHELESLVVFADVSDDLEAWDAASDSLEIDGPFADGLGAGPANLVMRALGAFRERWPDALDNGLALRLTKNLPVASGLGGGSADAAAALRLLARKSHRPVSDADLLSLSARIGADVPVCLLSRPARMSGIGERISLLRQFPMLYLVLVNPMQPVSTPEVFRRLAPRNNERLPALPDPLTRPAQLGVWLQETRNDLETPAIQVVDEIRVLIGKLGATRGCMLARMSGSGATVFGLYGSGAQAHQAAHDMRLQWPDFWVAAAPVIQP